MLASNPPATLWAIYLQKPWSTASGGAAVAGLLELFLHLESLEGLLGVDGDGDRGGDGGGEAQNVPYDLLDREEPFPV